MEKLIDIKKLVPDDHNFNKGTEQGRELVKQSFEKYGAGRSVLLDKDDRLIAGNKATEGAIASGKIKKVRVIETDGSELIAVKRTDVSLDSKEGREMALLDNLTTQVNLAWDEAQLHSVADEVPGFEVGDFGVDVDAMPHVEFEPIDARKKDPSNNEMDVDSFGDKIKMTLEFSIAQHAFVQQALQRDGMTKEDVLLQLLGYEE